MRLKTLANVYTRFLRPCRAKARSIHGPDTQISQAVSLSRGVTAITEGVTTITKGVTTIMEGVATSRTHWSIGLGLQSSNGCVYYCTAGACIAFLVSIYNLPRDASIGATFGTCTGLQVSVWCIYRSVSLGLQFSKGWVYFCTAGASIGLLVSVYNHSRDASVGTPWVHILVYQSWSTIIQGMRLFLHCRCMYCFIGLDLQSSKGCFYFCISGASIGPSVLVYNHPRDASISALLFVNNDPRDASTGGTLVHVRIYWSQSTIIHGMRLLRHCRCMIVLRLQPSKGCIYQFIGLCLASWYG